MTMIDVTAIGDTERRLLAIDDEQHAEPELHEIMIPDCLRRTPRAAPMAAPVARPRPARLGRKVTVRQ